MSKYKLKNKTTGELMEVEANSDQEALLKASSSGKETPPTTPTPAQGQPSTGDKIKGFFTGGGAVKALPDVGAFAGSMLPGPAGVAGGAMGGGIGTLLKNLLTNKPFENLTDPAKQRIEATAPNLPQGVKDVLTPLSISPVDVFGTTKGTAPVERMFGSTPEDLANMEFLTNSAKGAVAGVVNMLIGKAGTAVAGPLKEIPFFKFFTPGSLQGGVTEAMDRTGKILGESLLKSTGKINTKPIIMQLEKVVNDVTKKGVPEATRKIIPIVKRLLSHGESISLDDAHSIAQGFGDDIYGEAGKELVKKGVVGIAEKKGKKITGGMLSTAIKDTLRKEGLSDGAKAFKTFHDLGIISKEMEHPFKNWWVGGAVAGAVAQTSGVVNPAAAAFIGSILTAPYTRFALRKIFSETFSITNAVTRGATIKTVGDLFKGKND